MPNPWLILGVVLAWIASLVAVGSWQNDAGHVAERVMSQAKDNDELKTANAEIQRLNSAARATEHAQAAELAVIGADHAKQLQDLDAQRRRDVADARSGALKLRVPGACQRPSASGPAETPAAAGRSDDPTTGELPAAVTADLLDLANDADRDVLQLGKCQATVAAYLGATP